MSTRAITRLDARSLARQYGTTVSAMGAIMFRLRAIGVVSPTPGRGYAGCVTLHGNDAAVLAVYYTMRNNWVGLHEGNPLVTIMRWVAKHGWPETPMAVIDNVDVVPWHPDLLKAGACVQVFGSPE